MMRRWGAVVAVALLAGCGGTATYAGFTKDQAKHEAVRSIKRAAAQQGVSTAGSHIAVLDAYKGHNGHGGEAWKVVLADGVGETVCVTLYATDPQLRYAYFIDPGRC